MTIFLDDETTWPDEVLGFLRRDYHLFLCYETRHSKRPVGHLDYAAYEKASDELRQLLKRHAIRGYHCTRLTEKEIRQVEASGMQLPNAEMLCRRIRDIREAGLIDETVAERLQNEHHAGKPYRANRIWCCCYPPRLQGQFGVERFFRRWGGEALYVIHENDPITGSLLTQIGIPCLVELHIPIIHLREHGGLTDNVARRFLVDRGLKTRESNCHDDYSRAPIQASNVKRIIKFPDPEFIALTGCDSWTPPL